MKPKRVVWAAACGAAVLGAPDLAAADVIQLGATGGDGPGLMLTVEVVDRGKWADVVFRNESAALSGVTGVYLERSAGLEALLRDGRIVNEPHDGVKFKVGGEPQLPGGWAGSFFSATASGEGGAIDPGESLTVRFKLLGSISILSQGLADGAAGFRVAERVEVGGGEVWATNSQVPTPGFGAACLAGGAWVCFRRRRRGSVLG